MTAGDEEGIKDGEGSQAQKVLVDDHFTGKKSGWCQEDLRLLVTHGGTDFLFDKWIKNGKTNPLSSSNNEKTTLSCQNDLFSKELECLGIKDETTFDDAQLVIESCVQMQQDLGEELQQKSGGFASILAKKRAVLNHVLQLIKSQAESQQRSSTDDGRQESDSGVTNRCYAEKNALVELGVTTGLSLVFALLKQNWEQNSAQTQSAPICNQVLNSALEVLSGLPPLSLSVDGGTKIPDVGEASLNQVTEFLRQSSFPSATSGDGHGSKVCSELLLLISVQRGRLSLILQWIHTAISVAKVDANRMFSVRVLSICLDHMQTVTGTPTMKDLPWDVDSSDDEIFGEDVSNVKIYDAALFILKQVRIVFIIGQSTV